MTRTWSQVSPNWLQSREDRRLAQGSHKDREKREGHSGIRAQRGPWKDLLNGSCQVKGPHSKYRVSAGEVSIRTTGACWRSERGCVNHIVLEVSEAFINERFEGGPAMHVSEHQPCPSGDLSPAQLWTNQQEAGKE